MNMLRPEEIIVPMTGSAEKKRQMDYAKRTSDAWYKLDTTLRQLVGRALPDAMRGAEVEQYLDVLNAMETLKLPDLAQVEMAKQLLSRMGDSRFLQQCKDIRVLVKVCQGVARLPGGRGMHHVTPELMKQLKGTVRRLAGLSYGDSIEESEPSNQQQQIRVGRSPTKGGKGGSQQQEQSGSKGKVHVSLKKGQQSQRSSTSIPDLRCAPDQLAVMLSWMLDAGTPQVCGLPASSQLINLCALSTSTTHQQMLHNGCGIILLKRLKCLCVCGCRLCRSHKQPSATCLSKQHGMQ
jgi:hypothetical protein